MMSDLDRAARLLRTLKSAFAQAAEQKEKQAQDKRRQVFLSKSVVFYRAAERLDKERRTLEGYIEQVEECLEGLGYCAETDDVIAQAFWKSDLRIALAGLKGHINLEAIVADEKDVYQGFAEKVEKIKLCLG